MKNLGADQTVQMRRLICAFVVHKQQSQDFLCQGPHMKLKPRLPGLSLATPQILCVCVGSRVVHSLLQLSDRCSDIFGLLAG